MHRISQVVESGKCTSAQNIVFERKKTNHIAIVAGTEIVLFSVYLQHRVTLLHHPLLTYQSAQ